jgi:hypothetical protein
MTIVKAISDYFFQFFQIIRGVRFHLGDSSKTPSTASK